MFFEKSLTIHKIVLSSQNDFSTKCLIHQLLDIQYIIFYKERSSKFKQSVSYVMGFTASLKQGVQVKLRLSLCNNVYTLNYSLHTSSVICHTQFLLKHANHEF